MAVGIGNGCDDIYYAQNLDCDDNDDTISPDAIEVCDGIDNDCDGNADSAIYVPAILDNNGRIPLLRLQGTWSVAKENAQVGITL